MRRAETLHAVREPATARREEALARLAAVGPRPLEPADPLAAARPLARALAELGPGFAWLGLHLGARPDVALEPVRRALLGLGERPFAPAEPAALAAGLGQPPAEVFASFAGAGMALGPLVTSHEAVLADGTAARVWLSPATTRAAAAADAEHFAPAVAALVAAGWFEAGAVAVAGELAARLASALELGAESRAIAERVADPSPWLGLGAPTLLPSPSGAGIAAWQRPAGTPLRQLGRELGADGRRELARRLATHWLRQAMLGRAFPQEPGFGDDFDAAEPLPAGGGKLVFIGPYGTLPAASRARLWRALVAMARQDPDSAWLALAPEWSGHEPATGEPVRLRVRQALPFRDGAWAEPDDLAGRVHLLWRVASLAGFQASPAFVAFSRALAWLAATTRGLAPDLDALMAAVETLEAEEVASEPLARLAAGPLASSLEGWLALATGLPGQLDSLLERLDKGDATFLLRTLEPAAEARRTNRRVGELAAGLAAVAFALVLNRFLPSAPWSEGLSAFVFLVAGGFLLSRLSDAS